MADTGQYNQESFVAAEPARSSIQQDFSRIGTDIVDALGTRAEEIVGEQKARAASEIGSLAAMLRNAAQCVEQGERGTISDYAERAAGEIDRFADRLRSSSWRVIAADAEDFARRSPALFMTCSALAGFLLGRLLAPPAAPEPAAPVWSASGGAEPTSRPEDGAIGGTLTGGGAATGFGLPAGEGTR